MSFTRHMAPCRHTGLALTVIAGSTLTTMSSSRAKMRRWSGPIDVRQRARRWVGGAAQDWPLGESLRRQIRRDVRQQVIGNDWNDSRWLTNMSQSTGMHSAERQVGYWIGPVPPKVKRHL
jgi:hypothetical protein